MKINAYRHVRNRDCVYRRVPGTDDFVWREHKRTEAGIRAEIYFNTKFVPLDDQGIELPIGIINKHIRMKYIFIIAIWVAAIIGEVRCIYEFFTSDFEPSYKRECIYGFSAVCGLGAVVGYLDIEDTPR